HVFLELVPTTATQSNNYRDRNASGQDRGRQYRPKGAALAVRNSALYLRKTRWLHRIDSCRSVCSRASYLLPQSEMGNRSFAERDRSGSMIPCSVATGS